MSGNDKAAPEPTDEGYVRGKKVMADMHKGMVETGTAVADGTTAAVNGGIKAVEDFGTATVKVGNDAIAGTQKLVNDAGVAIDKNARAAGQWTQDRVSDAGVLADRTVKGAYAGGAAMVKGVQDTGTAIVQGTQSAAHAAYQGLQDRLNSARHATASVLSWISGVAKSGAESFEGAARANTPAPVNWQQQKYHLDGVGDGNARAAANYLTKHGVTVDKNNDGKITQAEFNNAVQQWNKTHDDRPAQRR